MDEELDDELDEDEEVDDHEWEYYQEGIQEDLKRESEERFRRLPVICQNCRWMDWYYLEECNYNLYPVNGKCNMFCRDYLFVFKLPSKLRLIWWDWQYRLWDFWRKLRGINP